MLDDNVVLTPYADTLVDGLIPPPGIQFVTRSALVDAGEAAEVLRILTEVGAAEGSPAIAVRSLGGAVARVPADATAYAHRAAALMIATTAGGPKPMLDAARPALEAIWGRLAPHVSGLYANFVSSATDADVAGIYPPHTYQRLAEVKRQYDPGNLFDRNHNVRP